MLKFLDNMVEHVLLHYRWFFVVFFLLPLSVIYEIYSLARNWLIFKLNTAPQQHEKRVKIIQRQVKEWKAKFSNRQMCTARPGWQTMSFRQGRYKSSMFNVRIGMYDILEVNVDEKYVRVEPMVTMGQLSRTLNQLGWTIPVLPEIDDLTVGGLIMGTGVETSSHKYGLFQHTCRAFEVVLCDGSVVKCSRTDNVELFHAIPWSHGTIGFLLAADIDIVPARKLVKLHYQPVHNLKKAIQVFKKASYDTSNDFVEAIMFSLDDGVVMTGVMVDADNCTKTNEIGRWYKPWFFKHVESKLYKDMKYLTEYIPLRHYYHRHTRSLFWELQNIVPFGNNFLFRLLLGWTMPPKVSLLKLTQTKSIKKLYETQHIIQDMLIPIEKLEDAIIMFNKKVEVYPLWLCPFKLTDDPGFVHSHQSSSEMYVDVGVYGIPGTRDYEATRTTREIEKFVSDVHGYQMLYADTYTTRDEFRKMFDHTLYDKMRKSLNCEKAFSEVYDKVNKNARI
ncbi:PREDICTED: delta(24)-sterol reductase-like [Ceratosolen solmsi marchali]|uniref:Delta(24)-sterol reductase n=1 Tax=Ceratosolen solmsi marchali TaxID=326594 RepID=A0AAJ6YJ89_9HYME|nr:PREDICTED: delta(24)-sterol reductase-like [Ceratosolen solmsi marchali]